MKTGTLASVADVACAEPFHFQEHAIVVAIDQHFDDAKLVAGSFAFGPKRAAGAAKKCCEAGALSFRQRLFVHEADHQDFGCFRILNHCRDETV